MADDEKAIQALYQAPLAKFVAERKRLVAKLHVAGDEAAARHLAKARRPTASAWTVNQLYWRARDAYDDLLAGAARMRKGDVRATSAYREALGTLRKGAAAILKGAGHGANEATLRRVMATLSALAAAGGFDPDPPGALATDRNPPGFDAFDVSARPVASQPHGRSTAADPQERHPKRAGGRDELATARARRARADEKRRQAEQRAMERVEQQRQKADRARRQAERRDVEAMLRAAQAKASQRERVLAARRRDLRTAEEAFNEARAVVEKLEHKLGDLDDVK